VHRWENLEKGSNILKQAAAKIQEEFRREQSKGLVTKEDLKCEDEVLKTTEDNTAHPESYVLPLDEDEDRHDVDNESEDDESEDDESDSCSEIVSEEGDSEEDEYENSFVTSCSEESEDDEWVPVPNSPKKTKE